MPPRTSSIPYWLYSCCCMVLVMVWIGGVTRLSNAGLSITEWKPISGILPPFTADDWATLFARYQESPEYRHINYGMSLGEFQSIFWLEYGHRLAGRVTGLVFLLPYLYYSITGQLSRRWMLALGGIFLLGALQGFMGWFMVKSGLIDHPDVSPVRLALHLLLACLLFMGLLMAALTYSRPLPRTRPPLALLLIGILIIAQLTMGAFVAGLNAGLLYPHFPLMAGQWIPPEFGTFAPYWTNFFENPAQVQWQHRLLGVALLVGAGAYGIRLELVKAPRSMRYWARLLLVALFLQLGLGIATLLWGVPLALASLHQMGALLVIAIYVRLVYASMQTRWAT